jgi:hypothetical protein
MSMRYISVFFLCIISIAVAAQQDGSLRDLDRTLKTYFEKAKPLNLHLSLNQPSFVPGDTIFFKATAIYAGENRLVDKNTIVHVMLMNESNQAVVNQKIRIVDGVSANQLAIPKTISPGLYVLVGYHDWMKTGSPQLFYQNFVLIHGTKPFVPQAKNELNFFPEGGHLVTGVANRIVVSGNPNTTISIKDQNGKEVAITATDGRGFGSFILTPAANTTYSAALGAKSFELPGQNGAVALIVNKADDDSQIQVNVSTLDQSIARVRVTVDAGNEVFYNALLKMDGGKASTTISLSELPGSVARVTLFNEKSEVYAERLFYVNQEEKSDVNVSLDATTFATREKVTVKVKNTDAASQSFSATIFNNALHTKASLNTLPANFSLYGTVGGSLTNSTTPFTPTDPAWRQSIDLFLVSKSNLQVSWTEVLTKKQFDERHVNIRFSGQIINEKTGSIMTDTTFVTLFLQKNVILYQTFTNKGKFDLPLYIDFFGDDEVYYRIEKRGKPVVDAKMVIVDEPKLSIEWPLLSEVGASDPVFVNARQRQLINSSFGYLQQQQNYKRVTSANAAIEEEIFGADEEVDLEKYVLFPTMEETIREIVPMVQHRKSKGVSSIRVYFSDINRQATVNPVFIIDGIMTDDIDYFMSMKPTDVSKIKVVNTRDKLKTFGAIGRGGVILVDTKISDSFNKIPRSKNSFIVHGLSAASSPKNLDRPAEQQRTPDLRSSLYWNPNLVFDENGEATFTFYTSDVTGEYHLQIEGLTVSGKPFAAEKDFVVEFKRTSN